MANFWGADPEQLRELNTAMSAGSTSASALGPRNAPGAVTAADSENSASDRYWDNRGDERSE